MSVFDQSRLLQRLKEQGYSFEVVFDVGASIGRWTREVQTVFPDARFELFEPLAGRVPEVDNASLVGQLMHATLHPVALSDRTGQGEIKFLAANGVGSSILILEGDRKKPITIIPCDMERMDDIVERKGLPQPDLIKIDTQAAELKVLIGAENTIRGAKFILLEVWMRRVYGPETPLYHEVAAWLAEHDYVPFDFLISDEGRDADGTLRWFDAVFINQAASRFQRTLL